MSMRWKFVPNRRGQQLPVTLEPPPVLYHPEPVRPTLKPGVTAGYLMLNDGVREPWAARCIAVVDDEGHVLLEPPDGDGFQFDIEVDTER